MSDVDILSSQLQKRKTGSKQVIDNSQQIIVHIRKIIDDIVNEGPNIFTEPLPYK